MDLGNMSDDEKTVGKVRVKFVTKDPTIRVTETPVAVPESLQRYGLSEVVNHLLGRDPPTPFDMLVLGRFLRSSLSAVMWKNALSGEAVLEVEYMPAVRQPTEAEGSDQPDWVSAVATGLDDDGQEMFVTGCYDGCLRVYGADIKVASVEEAHDCPVTALCSIPSSTPEGRRTIDGFLSGGNAMTPRLWRLTSKDSNPSLEAAAALCGHANTISCLHGTRTTAYTGDWDGHVFMWNIDGMLDSEQNGGATKGPKRRKTAEGAKEATIPELKPIANFRAHSQAVTGLAIGGSETGVGGQSLYSASLDRAVKTWDAERQDCVHTLNAPKAITCLSCSSSGKMLATGHPDARVRIWDTRAQGETLTKATLASHKQWVTAVAWAPESDTVVLSCARDGDIKLWDIRSTIPLHSARAHEGKALCCGWLGQRMISGGTDGSVRTYIAPDRHK